MKASPFRPQVRLIGEDGNVFSIIGLTARALREAGLEQAAVEFTNAAFGCDSYDSVLRLVMRYVEVV
jgi:hypothetical protein